MNENQDDKRNAALRKLCAALKAFGDSVADCRADNSVLPWPPMLPYVHPAYWNGKRRLFYIGRDTFGWDLGGGGFSDFFDKYDQGDFAGYLAMNASALPLEKRATGWAGWTGSFWHAMNLLHLRIRLGRIVESDAEVANEKAVLAEMGYGNLNSIELPESLQNEKCWDNIDKDKYWRIKAASQKHLDRYELLFDAFQPDVSIIASWSGSEADYFREMDYAKIADETKGKLKVAVYRVSKESRSSVVVWTYHPSYLPRIKVRDAEFVEEIASVVARYAR